MAAKPNEIEILRTYDAPVKLVWDAWVDPKKAAHWWGPRGFTITTKSKELKVGGRWIYTMHGPDGVDYPNIATYHEIVPYKKLVYDHGATETTPPLFKVTVTFDERNGKTSMRMIMALATEADAKATKQFIKQANGNSTWDRFAEYLEQETAGKDVFVINRSFHATPKQLFDFFADPDLYPKWMGPKGVDMSFLRADIKEGGSAMWCMKMPDGTKKFGQLNYKKIASPGVFSYTQNFCDESGKPVKLMPTYPDVVLMTATITEEDAEHARMTIRWEIVGNATDAERKTFTDMRSVMTTGWNESFDKVDEMLLKR